MGLSVWLSHIAAIYLGCSEINAMHWIGKWINVALAAWIVLYMILASYASRDYAYFLRSPLLEGSVMRFIERVHQRLDCPVEY